MHFQLSNRLLISYLFFLGGGGDGLESCIRYGFLLLENVASQDPLSVSVAILHQFNILPEMYQVGYTKLFFRTGQVLWIFWDWFLTKLFLFLSGFSYFVGLGVGSGWKGGEMVVLGIYPYVNSWQIQLHRYLEHSHWFS